MDVIKCQAITDWLNQSDYLLIFLSMAVGFSLGYLVHWFCISIEKSE